MNNKEIPKKETNTKKTKGIFKHPDDIENKHIRAIVKGASIFFGGLIPLVLIASLSRFYIGKIILSIFILLFAFWVIGRITENKPSPPEESNTYY